MRLGHVRAVDLDGAAGRADQPADDLEKGGLAAAAGAEQRYQLPLLEIETDVFDRDERRVLGAPEGLMNVLEVPKRNRGGAGPPLCILCRFDLNGSRPLSA
jgi:hypothetical protein